MTYYIELEKGYYEEAEVRSIDFGRILVTFKSNSKVIEVHSPKTDYRTSHVGISGFVREGSQLEFRQIQFDCYPTKPRSK